MKKLKPIIILTVAFGLITTGCNSKNKPIEKTITTKNNEVKVVKTKEEVEIKEIDGKPVLITGSPITFTTEDGETIETTVSDTGKITYKGKELPNKDTKLEYLNQIEDTIELTEKDKEENQVSYIVDYDNGLDFIQAYTDKGEELEIELMDVWTEDLVRTNTVTVFMASKDKDKGLKDVESVTILTGNYIEITEDINQDDLFYGKSNIKPKRVDRKEIYKLNVKNKNNTTYSLKDNITTEENLNNSQ